LHDLAHYFEKCGIQPSSNEHLSTDPDESPHAWQAAVAMITAILFQVMQLYRICRFASEKKVLKRALAQIEPEQYFDDRWPTRWMPCLPLASGI